MFRVFAVIAASLLLWLATRILACAAVWLAVVFTLVGNSQLAPDAWPVCAGAAALSLVAAAVRRRLLGARPARPHRVNGSRLWKAGRVRVLVVEDELEMGSLLQRGLRAEGMLVDLVSTGEDGVWRATATDYEVIALDVMLPGIDGFEACRRLRAAGTATPVLMLTARDAVGDRVHGLNGGADDYLVKPFAFEELVARLRALARRGPVTHPAQLVVGDLRLDRAAQRVWRGETELDLSAREFVILAAFMSRPGEVLSRLELIERAWDQAYESRSNVVDVFVRRLREKIDRPFGRESLETVRGAGYRLRDPGGPVGTRSTL
jgi:two-component system OmpR family response regulator